MVWLSCLSFMLACKPHPKDIQAVNPIAVCLEYQKDPSTIERFSGSQITFTANVTRCEDGQSHCHNMNAPMPYLTLTGSNTPPIGRYQITGSVLAVDTSAGDRRIPNVATTLVVLVSSCTPMP